MNKTRSRGVDTKMSKLLCTDVASEAGKAALKKSVEQIIRQNKKVFDNLAKS
jgi:hypothetical protein